MHRSIAGMWSVGCYVSFRADKMFPKSRNDVLLNSLFSHFAVTRAPDPQPLYACVSFPPPLFWSALLQGLVVFNQCKHSQCYFQRASIHSLHEGLHGASQAWMDAFVCFIFWVCTTVSTSVYLEGHYLLFFITLAQGYRGWPYRCE